MIDRSIGCEAQPGNSPHVHFANPFNTYKSSKGAGLDENSGTSEDPWAVWPYSWAHNSWNFLSDRLHSFHKNQDESNSTAAETSIEGEKPAHDEPGSKLM